MLTTSPYGGYIGLARDQQGTVAATWSEVVDGESVVRVATKPPGQPFGPVRDISDPVSDADHPQVGVGGGTVVVTWTQERRVRAAVGKVDGGFALQPSFSTPPPSMSSATPRVAVAETGAAVIAWEEYHGTNDARCTSPPGRRTARSRRCRTSARRAGSPTCWSRCRPPATRPWPGRAGPRRSSPRTSLKRPHAACRATSSRWTGSPTPPRSATRRRTWV